MATKKTSSSSESVKQLNVEEKFQGVKAWWQSKTIIGVIIMALSYTAKIFLPAVDIDLQGAVDETLDGGTEIAQGVDSIWTSITTLFGAVLALYGRVKAKLGIKAVV